MCAVGLLAGLSAIGDSSLAKAAVRHVDMMYNSPGNYTRNRFDLYHSNGGIVPGMPTIIDLHGGGYTTGDKGLDQQVCGLLADQGYTVCAMNYTLAATDGTQSSFPQTFRDVRGMIHWIRTEGVAYGLSPTIIVVGHSAGGTIGLAAAFAPETPEFTPALPDPEGGYRVDATVGVFGRYDLVWDAQTYGSPLSIINYLAGPITLPGYLNRYAAAAARTYVHGCTPPTKLIVGDQDQVVPPGNSYRLAAALADAGVPSELQVVAGAGHGSGQLGSPSFLAGAIGSAIPNLLGSSRLVCVGPPPANDRCADAVTISAEQSLAGTTFGALADTSIPCGQGDARDVWFLFVPPASRRYTVDTFGTTGIFDTTLAVFDSCQPGASLLGCNDNAEGTRHAQVSLSLTAGQPVFIRAAGTRGSAGEFQINVDAGVPTAPPPVNDHCQEAVPLPLGVTLGTSIAATGGSLSPCGASDFTDVWFYFDAPTTGSYRFETFGSLGLTDSTLALYVSCTSGECLGCNDNADDGGTYSRLGVALMAGQRVLIRIAGQNLSEGSFALTASAMPSGNDQGACCLPGSGGCALTIATECAGTHHVGLACSASPCGGLPGACCTGSACQLVDAAAGCAGTFKGPGVACGTQDNPVACCPANFNQIDGLSVQDIFDFLYAYFGQQPRADFNQSGSITVQDVFDFLSAYLIAGCG